MVTSNIEQCFELCISVCLFVLFCFFLGEVGKGLEKVRKIEQIFSVTESIPAGENFPVVT